MHQSLWLLVLFGSAYGVLSITLRREFRRNGHTVTPNQQLKALQEGLGAIRDVLLDGSQLTYLKIYRQADLPQRQLRAKNAFLSVSLVMYRGFGHGCNFLGGLLVLQREAVRCHTYSWR